VKTASEYRQLADECRTIAKTLPEGGKREQLITIAETWEQLANERESSLSVQPGEAAKQPPKD
jgi:hypothetical protein